MTLCVDDPISRLPDHILVTILSLLEMKEAAQTSILSRRWKNLWSFINSTLDFDASMVLSSSEQERLKFVKWVDHILNSHKATTLDDFVVRFDLDIYYSSYIDTWIRFALQKRVQRLVLHLGPALSYARADGGTNYSFPSKVLGFSNMKFLTDLVLCHVDVTEDVVQGFLSVCPLLQHLDVSTTSTLAGLRVCDGASPLSLTSLVIINCINLQYFEISVLNLRRLIFMGPTPPTILFKNIPNLCALDLGGSYAQHLSPNFHRLPDLFPQIEILGFHHASHDICSLRCPSFTSLRHLKINVDSSDKRSLLGLLPTIEACPRLYKFVLEFRWMSRPTKPGKQRKPENPVQVWELRQLKDVELCSFRGSITDVEFAKNLIMMSENLEKITFDTRPLFGKVAPLDDDRLKAKECARDLAKKLPPHTQLLVF